MIINNEKPRPRKRRTVVIIVAAVLVVLVLAAVGVFLLGKGFWNSAQTKDGINYSPPTQEEKDAANTQKDANLERDEDNQSPGGTQKSTVSVIVVDASQYGDIIEVRGYTPGVIEDAGTCTATFTNPAHTTVVGTSVGRRDATTTQCAPITVARSSFQGTGLWSLVVSYASTTSSGASDKTDVTIK